jgi:hypothetical protein
MAARLRDVRFAPEGGHLADALRYQFPWRRGVVDSSDTSISRRGTRVPKPRGSGPEVSAAVDVNRLSRDEGCRVRGKECDRFPDLCRVPQPPHRDLLRSPFCFFG